MDKKLFTSAQTTKILNIPQRRLTNLVEKGITIPEKDSEGAGSRRLYNYLNLIELALAESLFNMHFGIHLVKKILTDLREDGMIRLWAEDFDSHFERLAKDFKEWYDDYGKNSNSITDHNIWQSQEIIKEGLKPKKPIGIAFYCFKENKTSKVIVIPLDLKFTLTPPLPTFLRDELLDSGCVVIIDLGQLKEKVDKGIQSLGE